MFRRTAAAFAIVAAWDWLNALSTRYVAGRSLYGILFVVSSTALWYFAVVLVSDTKQKKVLGATMLLGAGAGTYLGIIWP